VYSSTAGCHGVLELDQGRVPPRPNPGRDRGTPGGHGVDFEWRQPDPAIASALHVVAPPWSPTARRLALYCASCHGASPVRQGRCNASRIQPRSVATLVAWGPCRRFRRPGDCDCERARLRCASGGHDGRRCTPVLRQLPRCARQLDQGQRYVRAHPGAIGATLWHGVAVDALGNPGDAIAMRSR